MSALVGKRPRTSAHSDHPVGRRASGVGGCLRGACRGASATSSAESRNEGDPALRRPLPPSVQSRGSSARLEAVAQRPLFRVGLFADAQFADRPDKRRVSSEPTRTKFFRAAETRLAATLQTFGAQASSLACVVNLGDIYDGANDDGLSSAGPVLRPASGVAPEV